MRYKLPHRVPSPPRGYPRPKLPQAVRRQTNRYSMDDTHTFGELHIPPDVQIQDDSLVLGKRKDTEDGDDE